MGVLQMSTIALALLLAATSAGDVYKCRDAQGVNVYAATPCAEDPKQVQRIAIEPVPSSARSTAQPSAPPAGSGEVATHALPRGFVLPTSRCIGSTGFLPLPLWNDMRADFEAQRFDALERRLEGLAKQYPCTDRPLAIAFSALRDGAPGLTPLFDAWVQARPGSAHAYAARGGHYVERAMTARGGKLAAETAQQRFANMYMILARAFADFDAAIRLDPGHGHARGQRLVASRLTLSPAQLRALYQADRKAAPASFAFFFPAAAAFEPRWGGSVDDVLQAGRDALERAADNPDLELLPSHAQCIVATSIDGKPELALAAVDAVLRRGGRIDPSCYAAQGDAYRDLDRYADHVDAFQRYRDAGGAVGTSAVRAADSLRMLKRYDEALALFDDALRFRNGNVDALCARADVLRAKRRLEEGLRSVEQGLALDPADGYCVRVKARLHKLAASDGGS
jgi:tetratricopeptide (TPR) repeat protein